MAPLLREILDIFLCASAPLWWVAFSLIVTDTTTTKTRSHEETTEGNSIVFILGVFVPLW
jgi:hypothetical protein